MWLRRVVVVVVATWAVVVTADDDEYYCRANDTEAAFPFATKTAYYLAKGRLNPSDLTPQGCQARQMWQLARHGTRYPSPGDVKDFMERLPPLREAILQAYTDGKGTMCTRDIGLLHYWTLGDLTLDTANHLAPEGVLEHEGLAMTYVSLLPGLLGHSFSNESFKFRHTDTQRTRESARAYARGLFGDDVGNNIYIPDAINPDPLLEFSDLCNKYVAEVENNPDATIEVELFKNGPIMQDLLQGVSSRSGIDVDFATMEVMYDACRFYRAWEPASISPWCTLFTPEELEILEYWQDLKYYYEDGYGHAINYEQACPPLSNLISTFRRRVVADEGPYGVFYFSHSSALLKVMTRLGLYEDAEPLTHATIDDLRAWRTSLSGIFSTNVAFVLSYCEDSLWSPWWVSLSVNERMVQLPGCHNSAGCSWQEFLDVFGYLEQCDFDAICENVDQVFQQDQSNWLMDSEEMMMMESSASDKGGVMMASVLGLVLGLIGLLNLLL